MINYVGESRIDGYPLVTIDNDVNLDFFMNKLKNLVYNKEKVNMTLVNINSIDINTHTVVKIHMDNVEFKKLDFNSELRKEKIIKINEI